MLAAAGFMSLDIFFVELKMSDKCGPPAAR
jgi:hypothetical protein